VVDASEPEGRRRILVVDDDRSTRTLLRQLLTTEGYAVDEASDAAHALQQVVTRPPDLILLDIMMPVQDGLDALAVLRRTSDVPVILLTAKDGESDRVVGLRLGADDYVVKPFSPAELAARISTVLRRARPMAPPAHLDLGDLHIDLGTREVTARGRVVDLPAREYEMLAFLAGSPRRTFSRDELLERVWPSSADRPGPATVTEHVRRIRSRIEKDPDHPRWIRTVRGVGYRFDP
jgi:two-component system phosphate regulon response regulator PhoB